MNFDFEFKLYCNVRDVTVNFSDFDLMFVPPTNWEIYRQNAVDSDNIGIWTQIKDDPTVSKRFARKRYLGWTEDEIVENERMWLEENPQDGIANQPEDEMAGGFGGFGPMGGGGLAPPTDPMAGGTDFGGGLDGGMGADAGGGGGVSMSPMGGGMGETKMTTNKSKLNEAEDLTFSDIEPAPVKRAELPKDVPNDRLFMRNNRFDPEKDGSIKLSTVRKIRKAHMARRIEQEKHLRW